MDGFKDSTRTMYSMGGSAYAKGGSAKGGSKDMAQDKATASMAVHKHERALHKGAPMTKLAKGGSAMMGAGGRSRMPSAGDSVGSGNRMSAMENREEIMLEREAMASQMRARQAMAKKAAMMRPSAGDSVGSGNRMSAMENREAMMLERAAMDKNMAMGGGVKKAMGGDVKKAMHGGGVKKAMGKKDC